MGEFSSGTGLPRSSQAVKRLCVCVCCVGKGKGTPALRRGIHCIGIDVEDESEQSDWQGFD